MYRRPEGVRLDLSPRDARATSVSAAPKDQRFWNPSQLQRRTDITQSRETHARRGFWTNTGPRVLDHSTGIDSVLRRTCQTH